MPIYCITGTNRGLGLEFVRQLAQSADNTIIATARPSADLADLEAAASATTHVVACDTADAASMQSFAREASSRLGGRKIDFLVNSAGVNNTPAGETSLSLDAAHLARQVATNVAGPAKVVEFLLGEGALAPAVRVANLTSGLGSMALTLGGGEQQRKCAGYSISKAALNMLAVHQAGDLRARAGLVGAVVVVVDPGWVRTRMGGPGAAIGADESVGGMLRLLHGLGDGDNGKFFQYDGTAKPW